MKLFKSYFSLIALMIAFVSFSMAQDLKIANFRAPDQSGINVFETAKEDVKFDGIKVRIGGNFAQQFQALSHENLPYMEADEDGVMQLQNALKHINPGFNLATANFNVDVQLADGIRLNMVTYLSSRHHVEAWVKGGYIQFDKLPFGSDVVDEIMKYVTVKVGHMEINYGDGHFRRTDNGNAIYNPFVGNYIMDAFNTEIGGEIYFQKDGFLAMAGITNGEIKGNITSGAVKNDKGDVVTESKVAPAILGKIGYDNEIAEDVRVRLTASIYHTSKSAANHIYDGDRGGSRYYSVLYSADPTARDNFRSGRFNPGFKSAVTSVMVNPFVKVKGLEVFGLYEYSQGGTAAEVAAVNTSLNDGNGDDRLYLRDWNQVSGEVIYRFFKNENVFLGARYNTVYQGPNDINGEKIEDPDNNIQRINRVQIGAGWFVTPNILLKGEYVNQAYKNFPVEGLYSEGLFKGIMIEAVVGF